MSRFTRIRNLYDVVTNPERYRSDDEVDLDETTSPTEWRDQTQPTLGQRLASRKRIALAFSFIGFIALGLVAVYSQRYLPGLYGNIWLKRAIVVAIAVPTLFIVGASWQRGRLKSIDRLDLMVDGEPKSYYGQLDTDAAGNRVFTPLKGFDFFGMRARQLTLADMDDDLARSWAKANRDPEDPVKIRVEDAVTGDAETATGTVVVSLTSGLELDVFGRESDLYTKAPNLADEQQYRDLATTLDQVHEENAELRSRVNKLEDRRDYWKMEAQKERQEIIEEIKDTHAGLAEAGFGPQGRQHERPKVSISADGEDQR